MAFHVINLSMFYIWGETHFYPLNVLRGEETKQVRLFMFWVLLLKRTVSLKQVNPYLQTQNPLLLYSPPPQKIEKTTCKKMHTATPDTERESWNLVATEIE